MTPARRGARTRVPRATGSDHRLALLVERLHEIKHEFSASARVSKRRILETLARRSVRRGALLLRLHEALCFMRAYPDDSDLLARVDAFLAGFADRVAALSAREAGALEETGVAGTTVYCPLSFNAARWLTRRFPGAVELDREDQGTATALAVLLPRLVPPLREEGLVEAGLAPWAWLAAATGGDRRGDLAWLLDRLERPGDAVGAALYDQLQPRLRWELGTGPTSRTRARVPGRRPHFHPRPLARRPGPREPAARVATRRAGPAEAEALLDAARAAVLVRYREVHAFNHADPADVLVADLGWGAEIAWLGVLPGHRLPLRAHYGYLCLQDGIPVGYGDASLLPGRCEIAYNVFETFRGGEAARLFLRLLDFVRQTFGVATFVLQPYQLGHDNDEALASGAFWFYYKHGFRPARSDLARLARDERARIVGHPGYRTARATLARLAEGPMLLRRRARGPEMPGIDVGALVRRAAVRRASLAVVARALGARRWRAWREPERRAFTQLAPFLAIVPGLADWPARDRRAVVTLVRAKGRGPEAEYLARFRDHPRLVASLAALSRS